MMGSPVNFCTLFNKNYLSRGLVTYESLIAAEPNAHLYIFPFDNETLEVLNALKLSQATIISLAEFEDAELLSIKDSRTAIEYCWTCTPSLIYYAINTYGLDSCTYIDSDMYFHSSPTIILKEMPGSHSVIITEHRYSTGFDSTASSGRFCVQFMTFLNRPDSIGLLKKWREQCIAWCYHIAEDGKMGDQGYIQNWPEEHSFVWIMQNYGGGIAPWNVQQYSFQYKNDELMARELTTGKLLPVIFYHFHYLRFYTNVDPKLSDYPLTHNHKTFVYYPYFLALERKKDELVNQFKPLFDTHGAFHFSPPVVKIEYSFNFLVKELLNKIKKKF